MRAYVAKKMNENITSDLVALKVRADGEVKVEVYNLQLSAKTAPWNLGQIFPAFFFMGKLAVSFFWGEFCQKIKEIQSRSESFWSRENTFFLFRSRMGFVCQNIAIPKTNMTEEHHIF